MIGCGLSRDTPVKFGWLEFNKSSFLYTGQRREPNRRRLAVLQSTPTLQVITKISYYHTIQLIHTYTRYLVLIAHNMTFTVFQDAPSTETPKPKVTRPTAMAIRSSSLNQATITSSNSLVDVTEVTDKENYHPVTGERAGPSSHTIAKKRKTNVLATKVHTPAGSAAKKQKDSSHTETKKHKASTSSTNKAKVASKRDGKVKKTLTKRPPSRKVSPMPKVSEEEEQVVADKGPEHLTQADIDSRCYELTVKPLADVSQAYEQVVDHGALGESDAKLKFCSVKVRFFFRHPIIRRVLIPIHVAGILR